jgi:hypothetical protein
MTYCEGGGDVKRQGTSDMGIPSELREKATRYFAMAMIAHERGDIELAEALTARATSLMEQADAAETGQIIPPRPTEVPQPNVQQQQQQQQQIPPNADTEADSSSC